MAYVLNWRSATLTVTNGGTESEELILSGRSIKNFTVFTPSTVTGVMRVYVADALGSTGYMPINDGFGNDLTLLAGKAQQITGISAPVLKIAATGAVGGDCAFIITGTEER